MTTPPRLIVRSRRTVRDLDLSVPYAVVSITDPPPWGEPARIPQRWGLRRVLRLAFHDVDPDDDPDHGGTPMTRADADAVWAFVRRWRGDVGAVVVHCEAGVSRSVSVAMALADGMRWGRECIGHTYDDGTDELRLGGFTDGEPPNAHVYGTMMAALLAGGGG